MTIRGHTVPCNPDTQNINVVHANIDVTRGTQHAYYCVFEKLPKFFIVSYNQKADASLEFIFFYFSCRIFINIAPNYRAKRLLNKVIKIIQL